MEIFPLKLGFVNAYLVKTGNKYILIDTGAGNYEQLKKQLAGYGCKKLAFVIITHGDPDHIGNCESLRKDFKVKIAMHKADYPFKFTKRKIKPFLMRLLMKIMIPILATKVVPFRPDIFLEEKSYYGLRVIFTPGHTKGSVVILTRNGSLISGDTIINGKPAYIVEDEDDLKNSIKKLSSIRFKIVYPGHGKPFKDIRTE